MPGAELFPAGSVGHGAQHHRPATNPLAISTMVDRAKAMYGFALIPDEALSDPAQVVERAVAWLQTGDMTAPQTRIR